MTLFSYGDTTVVLEKVCAYEYDRPRDRPGDDGGQPSLLITLDGGKELKIYGQGAITAFIKAMRALSEPRVGA